MSDRFIEPQVGNPINATMNEADDLSCKLQPASFLISVDAKTLHNTRGARD